MLVLAAIWLFLLFNSRGGSSEPMTIGEFQAEVDDGNVETANFLLGDGVIEGELSDGSTYRVAYVEATQEIVQRARGERRRGLGRPAEGFGRSSGSCSS